MGELKGKGMAFRGVALALIVFGVAVAVIGAVAWKLSVFWHITSIISAPFEKVIGGTIIAALGYVILELELIRNK